LARPFNLRVYALISNEHQQILLSKERRNGVEFTKFPGGGVEPGEGILDALHREVMEELGVNISKATFFYFNEFFQASSFNPSEQLVAFYYLVELSNEDSLELTPKIPQGSQDRSDFEHALWANKTPLLLETLSFPVDRKAMEKLLP